MSTNLPQNEMNSFYAFLGRRLENGGSMLSPEESVQEFRSYQNEVKRLHESIQSSIESGPAEELDYDALWDEVLSELAKEGITD